MNAGISRWKSEELVPSLLVKTAGTTNPALAWGGAGFVVSVGTSQKSQSSSSVASALPMTYDEPEPLKKSWFSS